MTTINITPNSNLSEVNISELKEKLKSFHDMIIKVTESVVGTEKSYNRRFVKPMESDEERFTLKLNLSKNRVSDLIIEYILQDSLGKECISFEDDYNNIKDIKETLAYIIDNLDKIKE